MKKHSTSTPKRSLYKSSVAYPTVPPTRRHTGMMQSMSILGRISQPVPHPLQTDKAENSPIMSPYELSKARRQYRKVFPNRVYTQWYRRYEQVLPIDDRINFQPFEEVQKIDEDIALQHFFGEDGPNIDSSSVRWEGPDTRRSALEKYIKLKEQEEKDRIAALEEAERAHTSRYRSVMKTLKNREGSDFGATVTEKKVFTPIIEYLHKMQIKKRRKLRIVTLQPKSKWRIIITPNVMRKLHLMYIQFLTGMAQIRFRRVIRLVVCVMRFINVIRIIAGSTKQLVKEIEAFKEQQRDNTSVNKSATGSRKKMFNPAKYTFKDLHIPLETQMTLTKPWFLRGEKEIDEVLKMLQAYKSFVQYPPLFQRRLARLAWYIEIESNKYIIREQHIACDFYLLLKGKAQEVRLFGDTDYKGIGEIRHIRYIRKSQAFGDESMSDPECQRDYSIISCEPCALLAISVYDYNVMLHTKKDNETAPEHIIFISHLKLLEDFPKRKLMEEGDENITIHYFRPDSAVTRNINTSKYVFVVINGSCKVLSEIMPEKTKDKIEIVKRSKPRSRLKTDAAINIKVTESMAVRTENIDNMNLIKKAQSKRDSILGGHKAGIAAEITELQQKTEEMMKTLPKFMRKSITAQSVTTLNKISQQFAHIPNFKPTFIHPRSSIYLDNEESKSNSENIGSSLPRIQSDVLDKSNTPNQMEKKASSDHCTTGELVLDETIQHQASIDNFQASETMVFVTDMTQAAHKTMFTKKAFLRKQDASRKSFKFGSIGNLKTKFNKRISQQRKSTIIRLPKIRVRDESKFYSKWKHIRDMNRGDYVGHEWLDFNNGPYEEPTETWSLISNGGEVIMIKRSFILKYLRKEW